MDYGNKNNHFLRLGMDLVRLVRKMDLVEDTKELI